MLRDYYFVFYLVCLIICIIIYIRNRHKYEYRKEARLFVSFLRLNKIDFEKLKRISDENFRKTDEQIDYILHEFLNKSE